MSQARLEELDKELKELNDLEQETRSEIRKLSKERLALATAMKAKKMRKRVWAYISRNIGGLNYTGPRYGDKVRLMQHTRKGSRYAAGAWVAKGKSQEKDPQKWTWFSYSDLGVDESGNIEGNRTTASILEKVLV